MKGILIVIGVLLSSVSSAPQTRPAARPEVWMCHREPTVLAEHPEQWAFVREHLDGIKLYIGTLRKAPADKLRKLAALLKQNNIKVAVECGGTLGYAPLDDTNGEASAKIELKAFRRFVQCGGTIDYLDMDGPVRRLLYPPKGRKGTKKRKGFTSIDRCADELLDYMRAVRKVYPRIQFFVLTNFPNWGYKGGVSYHARGPKRNDWGDYFDVLQTILRKTQAGKISLLGVTVDNPYDYATGQRVSVKIPDPSKINWIARIRDLEEYVEGRGLQFNLIFNSERGGKESAERFYEETLKFIEVYQAAGGSPKRYIIQSWYPHPKKVLPETEPYTMTALVKEVIKRIKGVSDKQ